MNNPPSLADYIYCGKGTFCNCCSYIFRGIFCFHFFDGHHFKPSSVCRKVGEESSCCSYPGDFFECVDCFCCPCISICIMSNMLDYYCCIPLDSWVGRRSRPPNAESSSPQVETQPPERRNPLEDMFTQLTNIITTQFPDISQPGEGENSRALSLDMLRLVDLLNSDGEYTVQAPPPPPPPYPPPPPSYGPKTSEV